MRRPSPETARGGVMAGHGVYRAASETQHSATASGFDLIAPAIDDARVTADGPPVVFADFGAAQGNNSLEPVGRALAAFRRAVPTRPVYVVHTDIVGNDFTTLASVLETPPGRYDLDDEHVLPLMAARSLYDRVLPAGQLAFGWTASTLHWLRASPGPVLDHFFVQLSHDGESRNRYAAQSARDWADFLSHRAVELAPGASVVVVDVLMDTDGIMGSEALFDCLNESLVRCRDDGALTAQEFARIVYPTWFRSLADLRAPFTPEYVAGDGERLELLDVRPVVEPDPFEHQLDDAEAYATSQVAFLRGFLEPSFLAALDLSRTPSERDAALDAVWRRTREAIAADPRRVSPSYRLVTFRVRRAA